MRAPGRHASFIGAVFGLIGFSIVSLVLTGCGTASATTANVTASPTPTCPPQIPVKTVSGHITSVGNGSISVANAQGSVTQVAFSTTTRLTQVTHPAATSLTTGTSVLVLTDTNATLAQRISVLGQGISGAGGFGFGAGRASGTPSARANAACFRRAGTGTGRSKGQGGTGQFQGIQGTIDSISATHLLFHDSQGQAYSVAITSATVIQRTAQASTSDLKVGQTVTALGTATSSGIAARSIVIQG